MLEYIIIKYILTKDIYNRYIKYINREYIKQTKNEVYRIFLVVDSLHKEFPDTPVFSVADLRAYFFSQYPALKKAEQQAYTLAFDSIDKLDVSEQIVENVLETHRKRSAAFELASVGFDIAEGKKEFIALSDAFKAYEQDLKPEDKPYEFVTSTLQDLVNETFLAPGLKWRHQTLRKMMGSLRKGDFGFIFTRPEVGKTTFLADNCSYMAGQLEDKFVLHFNNEESGVKIAMRYYQAALGLTSRQLMEDIVKHEKRYQEITRNQIKIYDKASLERTEIEDIIAKYNPGLIVFDSIDKIKGFVDDRDDLVYKQIYAWSRELAKQYAPVIGVCHAGASAENKAWLEMDDVAYAKTAKQGEADWILGIGQVHDDGKENLRYLHMPKNKLSLDDEMDEAHRHGKLPIRILPEIARYEDLIRFDQ